MKVTNVASDVKLHVGVEFGPGECPVYKEGSFRYLASHVSVTFSGDSYETALKSSRPTVLVTVAYRIKADGSHGARAGSNHYLGWHNTDKATYNLIVSAAREALA